MCSLCFFERPSGRSFEHKRFLSGMQELKWWCLGLMRGELASHVLLSPLPLS